MKPKMYTGTRDQGGFYTGIQGMRRGQSLGGPIFIVSPSAILLSAGILGGTMPHICFHGIGVFCLAYRPSVPRFLAKCYANACVLDQGKEMIHGDLVFLMYRVHRDRSCEAAKKRQVDRRRVTSSKRTWT